MYFDCFVKFVFGVFDFCNCCGKKWLVWVVRVNFFCCCIGNDDGYVLCFFCCLLNFIFVGGILCFDYSGVEFVFFYYFWYYVNVVFV